MTNEEVMELEPTKLKTWLTMVFSVEFLVWTIIAIMVVGIVFYGVSYRILDIDELIIGTIIIVAFTVIVGSLFYVELVMWDKKREEWVVKHVEPYIDTLEDVYVNRLNKIKVVNVNEAVVAFIEGELMEEHTTEVRYIADVVEPYVSYKEVDKGLSDVYGVGEKVRMVL